MTREHVNPQQKSINQKPSPKENSEKNMFSTTTSRININKLIKFSNKETLLKRSHERDMMTE